MKFELQITLSDAHIHLKRQDVEILFGKGYHLTKSRDLTIPGQFACLETVSLAGPNGRLDGVIVVGPERSYTQAEVSITNTLTLGVTAPLRLSGNIAGSSGIKVTGPAGTLELDEGLIAALRHIHMHSSDAKKLGLSTGDIVSVRVPGPRGLVFNEVVIKSGDDQALEMHVDFDEGHAAGIKDFQKVELLI